MAQPEETGLTLPLYHTRCRQTVLVPISANGGLRPLSQGAGDRRRREQSAPWQAPPSFPPGDSPARQGPVVGDNLSTGVGEGAQAAGAPSLLNTCTKPAATLSFPFSSLLRFLHKNLDIFQQEFTPWFSRFHVHNRYGRSPNIFFYVI